MNCEFAGYVTCTPTYWSERDDWTLAMVAAGLGFAFMPENTAHHPGVVTLPVIEPEFWRKVNLVTVRADLIRPVSARSFAKRCEKNGSATKPSPLSWPSNARGPLRIRTASQANG